MNTKISLTKTFKNNDHLLVLADKDDFSWTDNVLSASELTFLKHTTGQDIPYIFIPQEKRYIIVQFLKESKSESYNKEDARVAGNDILSLLSHYKIKSISIINRRKVNRTVDFLEGMALGNYQFLKYLMRKRIKQTI